jgi:hypothetical protein
MVRRRTRPDRGRSKILSFVIDLVIDLALLAFLLAWKPRYESLEDARRASRPLPTMRAEDEGFTPPEGEASHSGRMDRSLRRNRRHRRLARSVMTVCAVSTILILLSVITSPTIMAWHPSGIQL